jgi:hypothetical protein
MMPRRDEQGGGGFSASSAQRIVASMQHAKQLPKTLPKQAGGK